MITLEVAVAFCPPGAEDGTYFVKRRLTQPLGYYHLWMRYVALFAGDAPVSSLPKELRETVVYGGWDWR